MAISFSLTNISTYPTSVSQHHSYSHSVQEQAEPSRDSGMDFSGCAHSVPDFDDEHELPPRPESRLDFVHGSPNSESSATEPPAQPSSETPVRSHRRTPSATLKWTREILKKIRLTRTVPDVTASTAGSSSSSSSPPSSELSPPAETVCHVTRSHAVSSDFTEENTSISTSPSLLSSSSSNQLELYGDTDSDSDSELEELELESLEEIDLDAGDVEYIESMHISSDPQTCSIASSYAHASNTKTFTVNLPSPSPSPSTSTSASSCCSGTDPDPCPNPNPNADLEDPFSGEPSIARAKYTCLPSPLSPFSSHDHSHPAPPHMHTLHQPAAQPPRHLYTHRGLSRHALHYRKWFWATREDDWAKYAEWVEDCKGHHEAYAGMSLSPEISYSSDSEEEQSQARLPGSGSGSDETQEARESEASRLFPSLFSSARTMMPNTRRSWQSERCADESMLYRQAQSSPPLSIHPRWGDLAGAGAADSDHAYSSAAPYTTDTWCMHTDRYLLVGMGLGMWTIRKVLWLSELNRIVPTITSDTGSWDREGEGEEEEEEERTFVQETRGVLADDYESILGTEEVDDDEDDNEDGEGGGEVMSSSLASLDSLFSTTGSFNASDSDDSDVTLVESDAESDTHLSLTTPVPPSTSFARADVDASHGGRSVDFEKTFSSCDLLNENEDDDYFEDVDLGLGCGGSGASCSRSNAPSSAGTSNDLSLESGSEPVSLFRALYVTRHCDASSPSASASARRTNEHVGVRATTNTSKGKAGLRPQLSRQEELPAQSWHQQCEFLLQLTSARGTTA